MNNNDACNSDGAVDRDTRMIEPSGEHAVVLGASMAGLLAARVLAERYARVTVFERDVLPGGIAQHRRGVPHGRHLHALHSRGLLILDELFPGFADTLVEAGAVAGDMLGDGRWLLSGHRLRRARIGLRGLFSSRPFLEGHVRALVRASDRVRFVDGCAVVGLASSADGATVTGVRVAPAGGPPRTVSADLVIDATGRGSRTPVWLAQRGYPRPAEDRVEIGIGYATRTFRLRPNALGGDMFVVHGGTPASPRMGALAVVEGGRHMLSLGGILGDQPPTDLAGFVAFARSMSFPDFADALVGAQPLDDGVGFRFPANTRRRYERLPAFPARLLVIGDAVCSFNPVYGQGMTVAAMEAATLRELLADTPVPDPGTFFRAVAEVVDVPWQTAVGADLVYPDVIGERTPEVEMVNSYLSALHAAAATDPVLGQAFVRVLGMLDRPETLFHPDLTRRVNGYTALAADPGASAAAQTAAAVPTRDEAASAA